MINYGLAVSTILPLESSLTPIQAMAPEESMAELWATALHNYVIEGGWREVQQFIEENALLFGPDSGEVSGEFGEGEYALFMKFREVAAHTLDGLLRELGCSSSEEEEALATWLREHASLSSSSSSGPREAMAKAVLHDLMSVEDFASFVRMMRRRNDEIENLEALAAAKAESKHAQEAAMDQDEEWELQLAIADSIVSASEAGKLGPHEKPYVGWAKVVVDLASQSHDPELARELYAELEAQRFKVELSIAQRTVFEERSARAEAARAAVYEEGGSRDALIKATLARCDDLQRQVAVSRGACVNDSTVSDANLEMAYLLVKSLFAKRQDLAEHASEVYDALRAPAPEPSLSRIRHDLGTDEPGATHASSGIVFDLVRWCAIEAEVATVRRRLDSILAAKSEDDELQSPGVWREYFDAATNCSYFVNSATGESQWDRPMDYDKSTDTPITGNQLSGDAPQATACEQHVGAAESKADIKHLAHGTRSLQEAKSGGQAKAEQPPPPVGLPRTVPTWGRRLTPLKKHTDTKAAEAHPTHTGDHTHVKKAGMVLSPIALDFLKNRDIDTAKLPEVKGISQKSPNRHCTTAVSAFAPPLRS